MKQVWVLVFLSITLAFLSFPSAFALSCEVPTWDEEFENVDVVFTGKVIAKEYLPSKDDKSYEKYAISTLQVEEILKGSVNNTVKIKSNEAFWGIHLFEDWRYLIFGSSTDDHVVVSSCSNGGSLPPIPDPEKIGATLGAEYRLKQLNTYLLGQEQPSFQEILTSLQVSSDRTISKYEIQVPPGETKKITLHCNPDEYATSAQVKVTSGDIRLMKSQLVIHDPEKIRGESWRGKTTLEAGAVNNSNKTGTFFSIVHCKKISSESLAKQISLGVSANKQFCKQYFELIFKSTDDSPACVKPKTAEKLLERGWAFKTSLIQTFEECTSRGNPVLESYPRQCWTFEKRFVEEINNNSIKNDVHETLEPLQDCSRAPGEQIACPADLICYEHLSGGLGPFGSLPINSMGGDKKCHKECFTDNDCPSNAPICLLKRRTTEDYVEGFLLCFPKEEGLKERENIYESCLESNGPKVRQALEEDGKVVERGKPPEMFEADIRGALVSFSGYHVKNLHLSPEIILTYEYGLNVLRSGGLGTHDPTVSLPEGKELETLCILELDNRIRDARILVDFKKIEE